MAGLIKSALGDLSEARAQLAKRRANLLDNAALIEKIGKALAGDLDPASFVNAYSYDGVINVVRSMFSLNGFKDPALVERIEAVLDLGPVKESSEDFPSAMNRDYEFEFEGKGGVKVVAKICAWVRSDSESCRKVEVSRKPVVREEIVYQIVCD